MAKLQKQLQEERLLRAQARAQAEVKKKVREAPEEAWPGGVAAPRGVAA